VPPQVDIEITPMRRKKKALRDPPGHKLTYLVGLQLRAKVIGTAALHWENLENLNKNAEAT